MWRLKQFMPKESSSLEGRLVDVGNVKIHVRNAIAEGGFSCVYLARDVVNPSKQYAVKHIICNDEESLDLVTKEISVMRLLRGHPNVVMLVAHIILDMGRTKEALLVMELCEKSLVSLLESRGSADFDEKQILLIFREVCNAVVGMHSQSPPIAHRDLKAENVLHGSDGAWKLCDFGSTSTNHKCFDRPEEMGIEEDNIRKHTTPAYRAPEMWDLFRREVVSEKVDIWALGCLLYRICYFKSAFDGESKLQILNRNYRIPESPKYSASIKGLIGDMLEGSPASRPDIMQVWFRVNEQLPLELQRRLPDGCSSDIDMSRPTSGVSKKVPSMPRRSPPPPKEVARNLSSHVEHHSRSFQGASKIVGGGGGSLMGSFWSTQHAQDAKKIEAKGSFFGDPPANQSSKHNTSGLDSRVSPTREQHVTTGQPNERIADGNCHNSLHNKTTKDFQPRFFPENSGHDSEKTKPTKAESVSTLQNAAFDTFVADFDTSKLTSGNTTTCIKNTRSGKEEPDAEMNKLKEQLKQANLEKAEVISKYEKLSAICRSQRQEIQQLKQALSAASPSPAKKDNVKGDPSLGSMQSCTPECPVVKNSSKPVPVLQPSEKIEGTVWELMQGMLAGSSVPPSQISMQWEAFSDEPRRQPTPNNTGFPKSGFTTNGHPNSINQPVTVNAWGTAQHGCPAMPPGSQIPWSSAQGNGSQRLGGCLTNKTSQPSGWAGF